MQWSQGPVVVPGGHKLHTPFRILRGSMSRLTQIAISVALVSLVHWSSGLAETPPQARTQSQPQIPAPTQNPAQSQASTPAQTPVSAPAQTQVLASSGTQQPDKIPASELKSAPTTPI